jgi:hypothetical protein
MSWNMSFYSDVIAQTVAFKPAPSPVGHVDVDVSILKSDGTVRTTIATNAASSGTLSSAPATLSGTYSWAAYTVVDQTDYLEIDHYVEVASGTSGVSAYLRIDDDSLPMVDQTRVANVMLPSEYTAEVEFTGTSNMGSWTQLQWSLSSSWTAGAVATMLQLYDYVLGAYPTSGDGFVSYASNATANTDEVKTQTIATSPQRFRDVGGNWKVKVKGLKPVMAAFDFKADWVEFRPTYYSEYSVSTEFLFSSVSLEAPLQLNFTMVNEYDVSDVSVTLQVWNYSSSSYVSSGQGYLRYLSSGANDTRLLSIGVNPQFYVLNGTAKIGVAASASTTVQFVQRTNLVRLVHAQTQSSLLPFGWVVGLLYLLPVPFVLLLVWFLTGKREKKQKSSVGKGVATFSAQFGMTHEQMTGKKMLLEIDPTADYNMVLSSFVSEAKKSSESLFIVTNKDSALHSVFFGDGDANFFLLSSRVRYPEQVSETETLLPASDLSVILNACAKMRKSEPDKTIDLLFDNLSDVALRCGSDKTYNFTRLLLEAISSSKTTAVFVFIPTAHDQETLSSIRGLFHVQLAYTQKGPKTGSL